MTEPVSAEAIHAAAGPMLPSPRLAPAAAVSVGLMLEGRAVIARFELRDRDDGCWWQLDSVEVRKAGEWQPLPISR